MRAPQFVPALFIALIFSACSADPDTNTRLVSQFTGILPQVMKNDSGLFHGISLGMTMPEVKQNIADGDSLGEEQANYLQYEGRLAPQKFYDYDCNFDEKGLKDLTIDIHLRDEKNADALFADFKNYFTKKYGVPVDSANDYAWICNQGKRPARIALRQGDEYMYGELTISIYDKTFDAVPVEGDTLPIALP